MVMWNMDINKNVYIPLVKEEVKSYSKNTEECKKPNRYMKPNSRLLTLNLD